MAAGFGALYVTKALYDAGKEFQVAAARFRTLNLGEAVNQDAEKFARGTKVFGASSAQLMETLRESVGMFGGIEKARAVAPTLAALNAANSGLFSGKIGAIDEGSVRAIMRFNDMRGLTDTPQDFLRGLDLAQPHGDGLGRLAQVHRPRADGQDRGAAFKGLSDEAS
ncbi:hypothetical protein BKK79_00010 [Cupriavidus sp. USMAA2-4]|uniref:hypothetical protein n=1 Tax=Cupriavidus sp. USMAA2-4 TaxID=876364 RepID=UPI0008A71579|nr:hypothetical protein [Cupriavidus sp. USMAA2-4]AOY90388.1 hypothetical protein BKK79_00010 [Cupriavidus sp. USMAA2-4]